MGTSASIADIYYQIQDEWQAATEHPEWRLAVWVAPFDNVTIIDKFLEIERSALGSCDEVFFRFESEYTGDAAAFTQALWEEYLSWFEEEVPDAYDVLKALREDGMMDAEYVPNLQAKLTPAHLWSELLRLKSCIKGVENRDFCLYFPPSLPEGAALTDWFASVLKNGIPEGIRLVTIDYAEKRKVKLPSSREVILLETKFDMKTAINNEMDKECGTYDSTGFDSQYRKQIRRVMECTNVKDGKVLGNEVRRLFSLTENTASVSVRIATPLIAAQAYYYISDFDKSVTYADDVILKSGEVMSSGDVNGYPIWKVSMFLKAAIYAINKKRDQAIDIYELVAAEATNRQDAFYIMESYRMSGFMMYELGKKEDAFERFLLSLVGGSYLDNRTRRESTFPFSAYMALHLGKDVRSPKELEFLEEQLELWLGNDWIQIVYSDQVSKSSVRRKASIFS